MGKFWKKSTLVCLCNERGLSDIGDRRALLARLKEDGWFGELSDYQLLNEVKKRNIKFQLGSRYTRKDLIRLLEQETAKENRIQDQVNAQQTSTDVKKRKPRGSEDDDNSPKKTKLSEDDDKVTLALSYYGPPNTKATSIKFRVRKSQKLNVVFNEFERRIDAMGCQCNSITRVKYKDLIDGKSREDIVKALQNQGFFILSGSDKKLEEEILELSISSKIYFGLPEGMRATNRNGASKEVVSFSKGSDLESPYLHDVKNKSSKLLADFEMIAKEVLTELAKGMHLHEETFTQMLSSENSESEVRTIKYKNQLDETLEPGVPNVPSLALSSHVDKGLITFIKDASAEEHSVIQAKCPNDGYYANIPLGKDILVLSGNSLSVASNGRVHAMNHRLKWLDQAAEHSTRTSIVCSIRANPETRLGPIRWCNLDPNLCSRDYSDSKDFLYSTLVNNLRHRRYKESDLLTIGTLDQAFLRESPSVFSKSHHSEYRYLLDGVPIYGDQTIKSFAGDDEFEELLVAVVEAQGGD